MVGPRAFVTLSPRAEVKRIRFEDGTPVFVQSALRALAVQMHFVLPAEDERSWDAAEPVPLGRMQQHYERDGGRLARRAVSFERLEGRPEHLDGRNALTGGAVVEIDNGRLASITDDESWSYTPAGDAAPFVTTEFSFHMSRRAAEVADVAALQAKLPSNDGSPLDAQPADGDLQHRRDGRLADGVSVESMLALVDAEVRGARLDGPAAVKAAAYLRLHPEASAALVAKYADNAIGMRGRGFILDLLTQAGDGPAQAAMRKALSLPGVTLSPGDRGLLVQRFSFLTAPDPASVRYIEDEYLRAKTAGERGTAQGAATSLGALVQHLDDRGETALARQLNDRLQSELRATHDPAIQAALVAGLGNARRAENVTLIASLATNDDARVRAHAASALRAVDSADARKALLQMTGDHDSNVSSLAFASLQQQSLARDDWKQLATLVTDGHTNAAADASLVGLLRAHKDEAGADGIAMLHVLERRNVGGDNDLANMIRAALGG
jgi:hypothetical protein